MGTDELSVNARMEPQIHTDYFEKRSLYAFPRRPWERGLTHDPNHDLFLAKEGFN